MSALTCEVRLTWNGTTVLLGAASKVVATDVITAHFLQFAGTDFAAWFKANCLDARILDRLTAGERVALNYSDDTGAATAFAGPL